MFYLTEKPSLDLRGLKDITVKAGQEIKFAVPIKGYPPPVASWEQNGTPLEKGGRNIIDSTPEKAILVIAKAERGDTGEYTITLKNPSGSASGKINVTVLGIIFLDIFHPL